MAITRSTFYDAPAGWPDVAAIVAEMKTICDAFKAYRYRPVYAELRLHGFIVNSKKIRRPMHQNDLSPKRCRRYISPRLAATPIVITQARGR
jgi:hypothetical protein